MLKDNMPALKGHLTIRVKSPDSSVKKYEFPNLVVNTGKNQAVSRLIGNTPGPISHMALGSSATTPAAGNTQLGTELGRVAVGSATASGSTATIVANFPAGTATGSIAEAGLFNASSAGIMTARSTFSPIPKGAADAVEITWALTAA